MGIMRVIHSWAYLITVARTSHVLRCALEMDTFFGAIGSHDYVDENVLVRSISRQSSCMESLAVLLSTSAPHTCNFTVQAPDCESSSVPRVFRFLRSPASLPNHLSLYRIRRVFSTQCDSLFGPQFSTPCHHHRCTAVYDSGCQYLRESKGYTPPAASGFWTNIL